MLDDVYISLTVSEGESAGAGYSGKASYHLIDSGVHVPRLGMLFRTRYSVLISCPYNPKRTANRNARTASERSSQFGLASAKSYIA